MTALEFSKMNLDEVKKSVKLCMELQLTAFIQGSPGLGKSALVRDIAEEKNLKLIDIRLSQCDLTDLNGLPKTDGKKATFLPFDTFPLEDDPLPEGKDGWLIFLDELNAAPRSLQCAAYKLILDRMVGGHYLNPKVSIVAAGNLITDNAVVNRMSTALRSRMINLRLEPDLDIWLQWALANGINPNIMAYVKYKPNYLFNFDPKKDSETYACPRTWEMLSKLMTRIKLSDLEVYKGLIMGTIGSIGAEFISYCRYALSLPNVDEVAAGKIVPPKNQDAGVSWMVLFHLLQYVPKTAGEKELNNIFKYIDLMGKEYTAMAIKMLMDAPDTRKLVLGLDCVHENLKSFESNGMDKDKKKK